MRLEQLAAKRRADQRVAHRARARFAVTLEAPYEQRALVGRKLVIDEGGDLVVDLVCHVRRVARMRVRPGAYNKGASALSIASRARKMRERTVPTGHSMVWAISS